MLKIASRALQTAIILIADAFASSFFHQVKGCTPISKKEITPERLRQIMFAKNKVAAPMACEMCPAPRNNPQALSGGRSDRATITPTKEVGTPKVKEMIPAAPDTIARIISEKSVDALEINSEEFSLMSTPINNPAASVMAKASRTPTIRVLEEAFARTSSPSVVASDSPTLGPSRG